MYEINGYIVSYNVKTHKWKIRDKSTGEIVTEISGFNEAKKYCREVKG